MHSSSLSNVEKSGSCPLAIASSFSLGFLFVRFVALVFVAALAALHRLTVVVLVTWLTDLVKELSAVSSGLSRAGRLLQARVKEDSREYRGVGTGDDDITSVECRGGGGGGGGDDDRLFTA
ncbi:hypothetical protein TYRP_012846 [Tyrophagus putrescentiae]|nr:hypothetical protein TYRP_012846 [Tyrophagus putrescentiae]